MKKIILLFVFVCVLIGENLAQQTKQYKYHIFDDYLLNSAYVGSKDYYSILVGHDQTFMGLNEGSPQTTILSLHSRVGKGFIFDKDGKINKFFGKFGNVAFGLQLTHYQFGPSRETNIGVTYGYHLKLNPNYKTKLPRKLVLAVTPRLQRLGFSYDNLNLVNDALDGSAGDFSDAALGDLEHIRSWMFTTDVSALYQTTVADVGFSAINIVQTKNKLESESLFISDENSYETYDSLYSTKYMLNFRLNFIELYQSKQLDLEFIPTVTGLYAPKTNGSEYYVDLRFKAIFKEHIAGIRSEESFTGQLGLNVQHLRNYKAMTLLKPYVGFNFKNYEITYVHYVYLDNDIINMGAASSGGQISFLIKIGKDGTMRNVENSNNWK